ncbi:uncharacterized protein LOC143198034 isoform X3 [Rhynchophorus ferrugineus]|uniref:uncharacterized protein LOC143198034 isoform X3 n=1 Tax=Rhynchophorus ferrugineus TaxID=354439 RepID=UPI003FCD751D
MPSNVRPKGSGSSTRGPPVTPMSERQQMALLMQMTSSGEAGSRSPSSGSRSRDRNERGETPLHLAAIKGDVEQVCRLLAHRADPNVADFAGWTPLHEACNHGWYEVAQKLIQSGANVNAKGLDNDTPLHDAVDNGHIKLIKLLVEKGADIHAKNSKGKTPLDIASPTIQPYLLNHTLPLPESANTTSSRAQPRSRDDKKVTNGSSSDKQKSGSSASSSADMDSGKSGANTDDVYEFKSVKESDSASDKNMEGGESEIDPVDPLSIPTNSGGEEPGKRSYADFESNEENEKDEENKRKKRKEDGGKEGGKTNQRGTGQGKGQSSKQSSGNAGKSAGSGSKSSGSGSTDKKSPVGSPKPNAANSSSDAEVDASSSASDGKTTDLKVPPLKIVIPQSSASEQDASTSRNGKNNSQRVHQALPYVVASSNDSTDKDGASSNSNPENASTSKDSEKKDSSSAQNDDQAAQSTEIEPSTSNNSNAAPPPPPSVELHPRKRKMKQNREQANNQAQQAAEPSESAAEAREVHPHDQPITNCYKLFMNIRKQIEKRRKGLFLVQPKPPQGFKDYLMNRCTYVLANTAPTTTNINYPPTLPQQLKELFAEQEKERYRLRMQHVIEKEKLVLSVEQEILRVHGRAARALANQSLPFSVCTILRDEEVYNLITPEQEEKDRNARSRYNGRLFLSWLQDVDDKWEKIKENMLLRHHHEAESLHAVQKMNWEWKLKELNLCDKKTTPKIDELHVPEVHVSDDFDLLPA